MDKRKALIIISREIEKRNLSGADIARQLNVSPSTAFALTRKKNLTEQNIADFSDLLRYNFFRELADQYDYSEPINRQTEILQTKVKELEMEVAFLRRTLKDITGH